MKRLALILVPIVLLAGLIAWRVVLKRQEAAAMSSQGAARAKATPQVVVATVGSREITTVFSGTGTLESPLNARISSKISGRINILEVREGDRVRRGQLLVRLDASEIEAQVQQAQARVAEANFRLSQALLTQKPTNVGVQTQVKQQQAAVASARADYEQARQTLVSQIAAAEAAVEDAQARLDSSQADISNQKARINGVQANLGNARTRQSRVVDLYKQGFIAAQEVDDAKAAVNVQEAALETAQAELASAVAARQSAVAQKQAALERVKIARSQGDADVEAARQKLAQAQAQSEFARANTAQSPAYREGLSALRASLAAEKAALAGVKARRADTLLYSPMDGYVTERLTDPGSMATPGQALLALQSFREIWVNVAVPEQLSGRVRPGQFVTVTLDALAGQTFQATVIKINPSSDAQVRQFTMRASLDNSQGLFKPGMYARVTLVTERVTGLAVPREAVEQDETGSYVNVVDGESKVHRQTVTTGLSDAEFISVTSGLRGGEQVVTVSGVTLKDGQGVRLPRQEPPGGGASKAGGPRGGQEKGAAEGPAAPAGRRPQ